MELWEKTPNKRWEEEKKRILDRMREVRQIQEPTTAIKASKSVKTEGLKKIIRTGDIIEVYEYEKSLSCKGGNRNVAKGEGENQEKNYMATQTKRRDKIRRLICANFDSGDKFVTLTYKEMMTDLKGAKSDHRNFIRRLQRKMDQEVPYLSVIEFQKSGRIHFHSLLKVPYIENKELRGVWGNGYVKINKIKECDNVGAYLTSYIKKAQGDIRLKGERAYLYSKGLEKPREVTTYDPMNYRAMEEEIESLIKGKEPVYISEYDTEKLGKAKYSQYNLARR